jgi:dipeptidyl aminopeptidase/acylaminoacyl peptidase
VVAALVLIVSGFLAAPQLPHVARITQLTRDGKIKGNALATDGNRIYFEEAVDGKPVVAEVSANGGDTSVIPIGLPQLSFQDYSVVRSELLVTSGDNADNNFWRIPVPSGAPAPVGHLAGFMGKFSPDGSQIGFVTFDGAPHAANIDGSNDRTLPLSPAHQAATASSWVDDQTFVIDRTDRQTDEGGPWKINVENGNGTPIMREAKQSSLGIRGATWFAQYKVFAISLKHSGAADIGLISAGSNFLRKAGELTRLTSGPLSYLHPVPSSDGKRIFVVGSLRRSELVRYNASTKQFEPYLGGASIGHVVFSNDGQWVAYVDYPGNSLWRSRIDGSERLRLTPEGMVVVGPRWAPDGSRISFSAIGNGAPWRMYAVKASGGEPPEPFQIEIQNAYEPAWSPDGKSIVFGIIASREPKVLLHQLDLSTHRITDVPGSKNVWFPAWSRDGKYLLAVTSDESERLKIYDFETQRWSDLAQGALGDIGFYPDSKSVFYFDQTKQSVFRVRLNDRKTELIADLRLINQPTLPYWSAWAGLAPDGSLLVMRDLGTQEIYALELEK